MTQAKKILNADYVNSSFYKDGNKRVVSPVINKRDYSTKSAELIDPMAFPRSVEEIYTMGISLQYYIGDIYLRLAAMNKGAQKNRYNEIAVAQLNVKNEIQKLANAHLNEKLNYFYNNGGPVIEAPISEREAKELNGFFNRIVANYLNQMDVIVTMTAEGSMSSSDLESEINNIIIRMFVSLSNLYQLDDLKQAFHNMASVISPC